MSKHLTREIVVQAAKVHGELLHPVTVDRSFELPRRLYAATAGLYLGFLAVMAVGFSNPALAIPLAICVIFVGMFFAVPVIWTRMRPSNPVAPLAWDRFRRQGVATLTGRLSAGEATAQMLLLPVLIFAWAVICVIIAAAV